jgi:hypothetical protein
MAMNQISQNENNPVSNNGNKLGNWKEDGSRMKGKTRNKNLIYKCILKPIWTYGIQLRRCAKPSNTKIIQRLQSKVLRTVTIAAWNVSNFTLHNDLQIPFITEEIKRYSTVYYNRIIRYENSYVTELSNPLNVRRRLKLVWPSDLKDQREEEE